MKVDNKTIKVDQELTTEIDFNDYAIRKNYQPLMQLGHLSEN